MVNDPIADLLTRIRNAQRVGHRDVVAPASKLVEQVVQVLKSEGFIENFERRIQDDGRFEEIAISLRYFPDGKPMVETCRRVSRSGKRVYAGTDELPRVRSGLGIAIISTSQGVMSDREARRRKIGGEVLATIS